jgi:hypothetical protein
MRPEPDTDSLANTYYYCDGYTYAYVLNLLDPDADSDTNGYGYCYGDCNSYFYCDRNCHCNCYCYCYSYCDHDTAAFSLTKGHCSPQASANSRAAGLGSFWARLPG